MNSIYFLTMNIGGDGGDVYPWTGTPERKGSPDNDNLHFDISKLTQWETVFAHASAKESSCIRLQRSRGSEQAGA